MILIRIIMNLIGLATKLLWLPLLIISRNLFLIILVLIGLFIWSRFQDAKMPEQLTPAPGTVQEQRQQPRNGNAPLPADPILRREDGNSAFATDLYASMNEQERAYYSQTFYWAMDTLKDNQSSPWHAGNIHGTITPTRSFINGSGVTCREFREQLKVHTVEQTLTGTACPRDQYSWCKLKPNATPSCGLGGKPGFWQSLKNMF